MAPAPIDILLVDDEAAHRELILRAFALLHGRFHLLTTENLHDALKLLDRSPPDLILVDLLLPDGKGTELLSSDEDGNAPIPTIVMTSHGNEQVAVEAMKSGALDYVVKSPASLSDMPHIVERALREWEHMRERKRAEEELRRSLQEKTLLLQEIHHRTRNNMQVIDSLLEFQSIGHTDPSILQNFQSIRHRIRSMALVQEKLYRDNLTTVNLKEYLQELTAFLAQSSSQDSNTFDIISTLEEVFLPVDSAIPCGMMMNELLSNAMSHAFSSCNSSGHKIWIHLRAEEDGTIEFQIKDNGQGLADDVDIETPSTLGFRFIQMLVAYQLRGSIQCLERHTGTQFLVRFNPPQYNTRISVPAAA